MAKSSYELHIYKRLKLDLMSSITTYHYHGVSKCKGGINRRIATVAICDENTNLKQAIDEYLPKQAN